MLMIYLMAIEINLCNNPISYMKKVLIKPCYDAFILIIS